MSSERFIHDDLADRAARIAAEVRDGWKKTHRVDPFAVTWPAVSVRSDDGGEVDRAVVCMIPRDYNEAQRFETLQKMVARTQAYGLVLVLPRPDGIHVLFETSQGARAWVMKLERHGDVIACLPPVVQDDAECVGLLWRPTRGTS